MHSAITEEHVDVIGYDVTSCYCIHWQQHRHKSMGPLFIAAADSNPALVAFS